ncbi:MAG: ABC transporter ATP-binding protein [bacterium]
MKNKSLYHIRNLYCQYETSPFPVLYVEELDIEPGSVVFIVGPSGVGKSTILETLGLMNNTIKENGNTVFEFSNHHEKNQDLSALWQKKEKEIASFRRKHLSFIFQNTNLFPTLTVYENIVLPALLQGFSKHEAIKKAREILSEIAPNVNGHKNIVEISGGERQRVSFARSIIAKSSILFADEPTGNLDVSNAANLMNKLMNHLHQNNSTAVIVTHDIDLTVKHADKIVFISKQTLEDNENYSYGLITKGSTFEKVDDRWRHLSDHDGYWSKQELYHYLKEVLESNRQIEHV